MAIINAQQDTENSTPLEPGSTNETQVSALENSENPEQESISNSGLVGWIKSEFQKAKDARDYDERRWLNAYRNYRGIYGPDNQFTETEKSRAFIKVTKTKVLAGYSQITEILFSGARFPIGVEPTAVPNNVSENVHVDAKSDEGEPERSSTAKRPELQLGTLESEIDTEKEIEEGASASKTAANYSPAQETSRKMEKQIFDQLEESQASKHLRSAVFEQCLFGTGILKGPFAYRKEYPKWSTEGDYSPEFDTIPKVSHVSIWNFYPDPDARSMDEAEKVFERHRMSRSQLRALKKRPYFRENSIDLAIEFQEDYTREDWESDLEDYGYAQEVDRFEVLEFWGTVDREKAEEAELEIPSDYDDEDEIQINCWICNGEILRLVLNPFTPSRIPYCSFPYELNPYSFFGIGIAENMEDTQILMNGFMRMAVDNAALSGNLLIEVNESQLEPDQDMDIYPGKIIRRSGGAPGQAIFGTKFPNVSNELMQMFDKSRQLADESTGMPSYSHGQTGVSGVGRTASGISMLMGAASQNAKTVVRNIDDYLLLPLGRALFSFNMQFNFDEEFANGDLEVYARGTESLMRNEIRSQKLMQFSQTAMNPAMAPLVRWDYILREFAKSLDLNEDKIMNDPREQILQAQRMGNMSQMMNMAQQAQGGGGQGGPPSPSDPTGTGNGNVSPGQAPEPGAQGNTQGSQADSAGADMASGPQ